MSGKRELNTTIHEHIISGSFRDPDGFIFQRKGDLFRQINLSYKENYIRLMDSGLYKHLVESDQLIAHSEVDVKPFIKESSYCIVNETTADFSVFIDDVSVWMEPGMIIWGECHNYTDAHLLEIESTDPSSELVFVDLLCGDIVKIQARK